MKKLSFVSTSDAQRVRSSRFFDAQWYLEQYPDVAALDLDPVEHFLWIGHKLGRSPSAIFSVPGYLGAHKDVKAAGINPLLHYLNSGIKENRTIYPVPDAGLEDERSKCFRVMRRRHKEWDWAAHEATLHRLKNLPHPYAADRVSIVMPTFNRAEMIGAAIQSVLRQSHSNFDLIIVDDHSTDNTADIVKGFNDPRVRYTLNQRQKGVSGARNTGLDQATGDWLFFLDSDNTWKDRTVEFLLKHAAATQSSAGYCAINIQSDEKETKFILFDEFDFESCLRENFIDLNGFYMRWQGEFRTFRFDESLRRLVDWDLILRVAAATRVTGVPFVGVDYYDGKADRITNKEHTKREDIAALLDRVRNKSRRMIVEQDRIRDASSYRIAVLLHAYHPDRVSECIDYLRNIRAEFDLYVSTSLDPDHEALALLRKAYPDLRLFFFPNVGADLGPFLELISTFKPYELVLKIHTKRDVEPWGDAWRRGLLKPILGSPELVDDILEAFRTNPKLVMACGADFFKHGERNTIQASWERLEEIALQVDLSQHLPRDWAFVAGTMFWIRPQPLLKLARMMCDSAGYSSEFARDGAIEHGLERACGLALWEDPENRIALVSMEGKLTEFALGQGASNEGVAHTMRRLHAG